MGCGASARPRRQVLDVPEAGAARYAFETGGQPLGVDDGDGGDEAETAGAPSDDVPVANAASDNVVATERSADVSASQEEVLEEHEEIVLVAPGQVEDVKEVDENDPFVQQVEKFAVGCWFEFQSDNATERCKLAAIIKATGKYIFVNRAGVKVAEKTKMGLAVELRRGSVQILNDGLLFDRALESIITNLRGKPGH